MTRVYHIFKYIWLKELFWNIYEWSVKKKKIIQDLCRDSVNRRRVKHSNSSRVLWYGGRDVPWHERACVAWTSELGFNSCTSFMAYCPFWSHAVVIGKTWTQSTISITPADSHLQLGTDEWTGIPISVHFGLTWKFGINPQIGNY